jgi:hypothetical protein
MANSSCPSTLGMASTAVYEQIGLKGMAPPRRRHSPQECWCRVCHGLFCRQPFPECLNRNTLSPILPLETWAETDQAAPVTRQSRQRSCLLPHLIQPAVVAFVNGGLRRQDTFA